jgi:hypothetical protein
MADRPEVVYLVPVCDACQDYDENFLWWDNEKDAICPEQPDCPLKPVAYIRADLYEAQIAEMIERTAENAAQFDDEQRLEIAILQEEQNKRLKAEHDLHTAIIDQITENDREYNEDREMFIAKLVNLLERARNSTDDHELFSAIGEALPNLRPPIRPDD